MKLSDIFTDADQIHKWMHEGLPINEETRDRRLKSLEPLTKALIICMQEHGSLTNDPVNEFRIMMMTVCVIDHALEAATKVKQ
jgi:hypothetical protein